MRGVLDVGRWTLTKDPLCKEVHIITHKHRWAGMAGEKEVPYEEVDEGSVYWHALGMKQDRCPVCEEPAPDSLLAVRGFVNA